MLTELTEQHEIVILIFFRYKAINVQVTKSTFAAIGDLYIKMGTEPMKHMNRSCLYIIHFSDNMTIKSKVFVKSIFYIILSGCLIFHISRAYSEWALKRL